MVNDAKLMESFFKLAESKPRSPERHAMMAASQEYVPNMTGYLLHARQQALDSSNGRLVNFFEGALFMLYVFTSAPGVSMDAAYIPEVELPPIGDE